MKSQLLAGNDVSHYKALRERLMLWSKGDKEHRKLTSNSSAAMDVGALAGDGDKSDAMVSKILQGMQDMQSQTNALLAAMVKGGGGTRPPRQSPGDSSGKGAGGKPSGSTGKGPGTGTMVTMPDGRQMPQNRLRICRDFAKDGHCPRGKSCVYPHVSGLPKSLQEKACSNRGLLVASLGSMESKDGLFHFDAAKEREVLAALSNAGTTPKAKAEVGGLDPSEDDWHIEGIDQATVESIAKGFGGLDH